MFHFRSAHNQHTPGRRRTQRWHRQGRQRRLAHAGNLARTSSLLLRSHLLLCHLLLSCVTVLIVIILIWWLAFSLSISLSCYLLFLCYFNFLLFLYLKPIRTGHLGGCAVVRVGHQRSRSSQLDGQASWRGKNAFNCFPTTDCTVQQNWGAREVSDTAPRNW